MRSIHAGLAATVFLCILGVSSARADKTPELVQVVMKLSAPGPDMVGEFVSETPTAITVIELKSGKERTAEKKDVARVKRDLSDEDAIAGSDLASVMAWKVNKLSGAVPTVGRVAKVADSTIYLTIGSKDGLAQGQKLNAFRPGADITDPTTHKVIAKERPRIAQLSVTEVQEAYAKAKVDGELEVGLIVGDEVESIPLKVSVAVLPLIDSDGKETEAGIALSETMSTALVGKKVKVVERSMIMDVIKELAIQTSDLVDPATAQKLGKQIGASTILTGKIVGEGEASKVNVRLISVETGQVLLAASQSAKGVAAGVSSEAGGTVAPVAAKGLASIKFDESMGYTIVPEMKVGVSLHNNASTPVTSLPEQLTGKPFTQAVCNHGGPVHLKFISAGKVYILAGKDSDQKDKDLLQKIGKREALSNVTVTGAGRDNEIWSITAAAGKEFDIPFPVILVAGKLEKGK